jgi:hypothetical protein
MKDFAEPDVSFGWQARPTDAFADPSFSSVRKTLKSAACIGRQ